MKWKIFPIEIRLNIFLVFFLFFPFLLSSCGGSGGEGGGIVDPQPTVSTSAATGITTTGATLNGTVNPNGQASEAWFEWGMDSNLTSYTATTHQTGLNGSEVLPVSAAISGLGVGGTYHFRTVAKATPGGAEQRGTILSFDTLGPPPTVSTSAATGITTTGAMLNGSVNPNGLSTIAWFEWGTDPTLTSFSNTPSQSVVSGTTPQSVNAALTGLSTGTTYYYRAAASNSSGTTKGSILSFVPGAAPTVTTLAATSVGVTTAMLNGSVNPNGQASEAWFEWGTDSNPTSFTATTHQTGLNGSAVLPVSSTLTTLTPWSTYYFRVVASSVSSTQEGAIRSFPTGEYYVAVGDSITFGYNDDISADDTSLDGRNTGGGYEPILNDLLTAAKGYPHTVENEGVNDTTSADGVVQISTTLSNHPLAKYYLVMYGTNDALFSLAVPSGLGLNPGDAGYSGSYKDNMQRIISAIDAAGKMPYLAKVPYTSDPLRNISSIQEYNLVIDELVIDNGITVIPPDFYTYFQSHPGELVGGLHPTGVGYQSMANLWFTALTTP